MLRQLCRADSKPTFRGRRSSLNQWILYRSLHPQNFISSTSAAPRNEMLSLSAFKQKTKADASVFRSQIRLQIHYLIIFLRYYTVLRSDEKTRWLRDRCLLARANSASGLSRECETHIKVLFCINIAPRKGARSVIRNHAVHCDRDKPTCTLLAGDAFVGINSGNYDRWPSLIFSRFVSAKKSIRHNSSEVTHVR